jgi:hypothetical protein
VDSRQNRVEPWFSIADPRSAAIQWNLTNRFSGKRLLAVPPAVEETA